VNGWTVKQALHALERAAFVRYPPDPPDHAPEEGVMISGKTRCTSRKRFLEAGGPGSAYLLVTYAFPRAF
jgi:hypothetical protein